MENIILTFLTATAVVLLATPSIIGVADYKNLFEYPDERKVHKNKTPRIGGLAIFAAVIFSYSVWSPSFQNNSFQYVLACMLILFFVGIKDDIIGVSPMKKLGAQLLVAFIIVVIGDIRLTGLHGIFGIYDIPYPSSIAISIFTFIVITNSFNLIDGIDGLAAGIGLITSITFGVWFYSNEHLPLAFLAFSLSGALLGILKFNFSPAKIFMGDCGSLLIGFLSAFMAVKFIELNKGNLSFDSAPGFAVAVLIVPLFDTLRIFVVRVIKKQSPFIGDTNHIHHRILDLVFSQSKTALILFGVNILFIILAYLLKNLNPNFLVVILLLLAIGLNVGLTFRLNRDNKAHPAG